MKKRKANEKTNRKTKARRKRSTRSGAPSQKEIIQDRFDQKKHPAQAYAQKKLEGAAIGYPFFKYEDIGQVPAGGKQIRHWERSAIIPLFPKLRESKKSLPKSFRFWDHAYLMQYFGLRGWEFGNWVTNEDRMNYVCGAGIALYDLRLVMGIPAKEMGLEQMISLAIGARGIPRSLAHFEPDSFAINLTRYPDKRGGLQTGNRKMNTFLNSGGVGSLAHEYGHALDYFFGGYVDQDRNHFALSRGSSISTLPDWELMKRKSLRGQMETLLYAIIWKEKGKPSEYYLRLKDYLKRNGIKSTYYLRRNEIFARFFEQYIGYKLAQKGVQNKLLHKQKYTRAVYLPPNDLKRVVPIMDKMLTVFRTYFKK